jgi:heme exporter protein CcmD
MNAMHWHSVSEFLAMGGRGAFVWGAYGTMALLMSMEPLLARWRHRAARIAIAERMADEAAALAAAAGTGERS